MDKNILDTINLRELGNSLQEARKRRGLTQEQAAEILEVARTTITAIEKGERRLKGSELYKLAEAYGRQVSEFVRPRPAIPEFRVQFRSGPNQFSVEQIATVDEAIRQFEDRCRDYLELEQLMNAPLVRNYPREYRVQGLKLERAAESIAYEERNRLGLGDGPISILREILEQEVGLRIFYMELPSPVSEIYTYAEVQGGCIAISKAHPTERRRWSLAHGYAHFLAHRHKGVVDTDIHYQRQPESERFADLFALYFLMPTSSVLRRYQDIKSERGKMSPVGLFTLANYFGVSMEAITHRLEEMKLLATGTWDYIRHSDLKFHELQKELGLEGAPDRDDEMPLRYQFLALDAFETGRITEGQLAQFLRVDRLEARQRVQRIRERMGRNGDNAPDLTEPVTT